MNILVAIASRHGSTREIGAAIAQVLREAGYTVEERKVEDVGDVARYDAAVLGSAVYMGSWLPEMPAFIERHREILESIPLWLFSSGPIGPSTPALDTKRIEESIGLRDYRGHRIFAGKLDRQQLGVGERLAVHLVRAPEGDFRDWEDIREWARQITVTLGPEAVAVP